MDTLLSPSEIAGYAEGLRRLALSLVRDAASADDAVQETLVQALRSPPRRGPTTGAWFRTVLRNTLRRGWRSESRREAREATHATLPSTDTPVATLERTEIAHAVIAALRTLPPAQREALELRYFEDQKPAAISGMLGVPVETVKTRIKRGRDAMRAQLDRGERGAWVPGFVGAFGLDAHAVFGAAKVGLAVPAVVILGLLVVLGLWLGGASLRVPEPHGEASPQRREARALPTQQGVVPTLRGDTARMGSSAVPGPGASSRPQEDESDADAIRQLAGRVIIAYEDGRPVRVGKATLHYHCYGPGPGDMRKAAVVDGRFVLDLKARQTPAFHLLTWDGGVGVITSPAEPVREPFAEELVVQVRAVPDVRIHVVDADTGRPLDQVRWLRTDYKSQYQCHPGPGEHPEATWGSSPVRIRATPSDMRWEAEPVLVGAPGYGWESVTWHPKSGEPTRVELKPGGRARIRTRGPVLKHKAFVRVWATDRPGVGYRVFWPHAPGAQDLLEGLPVGAYEARLEIGRWSGRATILARKEFTVASDEVSEVALSYDAPRRAAPVPVRGTLHLPEGWPRKDLEVNLTLLGPSVGSKTHKQRSLKLGGGLQPVVDQPELYRMDAGLLEPGRYKVKSRALGYMGLFVVPPEGGDDLELRIPPPVEVRVRVEGDTGGREPFVKDLTWNCMPPRGVGGYSIASAKRETQEEPFVFKAPAGTITMGPTSHAYRADDETFEISGERVDLVLRVKPNCVIHVIARHEGRALPWDWGWKIEVEGVGHEATRFPRSLLEDRRGFWVAVGQSGRLRVRVGPIPGYEPLEERIVEVSGEAPTVITYDVVPRR